MIIVNSEGYPDTIRQIIKQKDAFQPEVPVIAVNGSVDEAETFELPYFNLAVPVAVHDVDSNLLDPRSSYEDVDTWDTKARELAQLFINNFEKFTDNDEGKALVAAGPQL